MVGAEEEVLDGRVMNPALFMRTAAAMGEGSRTLR